MALDIGANLGLGVTYTDNARLTASSPERDWIVNTTAQGSLSDDVGPLTSAITATYRRLEYLNGTYSNQNYLDFKGAGSWAQVEDRLVWTVEDYFTQIPVENLSVDTPENLQNTNVFSFQPEITIPVTSRNVISLMPVFQDYYYETSELDNRQYGLTASWEYKIYPTVEVGLEGVLRQVSYDNSSLNPDYAFRTLRAIYSRTLSRLQYRLGLGATNIQRDQFKDVDGVIGSADVLLRMTGISSLRTYLSSNLTDASNDLYRSSVDPETGDFTNEQVTGDVLRNNTARLTYLREGALIDARFWGELRDLDYLEAASDRKVGQLGIGMGYNISSYLRAGANGVYTKTRELATGRVDREYSLGGNLAYSLSRKLRCTLDLQYQRRNSNEAVNEYNELRVFAGITYDILARRPVYQ